MFIDQAVIRVRSGKGGDGVVHFRREKYVPRGGPDGGDGGKGGDVIFKVDPKLNTLSTFRHQTIFRAGDGKNGAKSNMTGKTADDLVIWVPPGTIVFEDQTNSFLGDLLESGQHLVVAKGGRGGRGNARFATSIRQVPRVAEKGEPEEERILRLELKLIADVGIVGVPNAGKSTLLAAITNAHPKIAPYPFTTLEPNLGIAEVDSETNLVLADIPGLIEGAHRGIGLGHDFLRHIQRTRVLIHLLDGMAEDPVLDFAQINTELALFDPELAHKPQVVAFNKIDLPEAQKRWPLIEKQIKRLIGKRQPGINLIQDLLGISAITGQNVQILLYRVAELLKDHPFSERPVELPVYRVESDPNEFSIKRSGGGWRVEGQAIERAAKMTYWEHYQSVRRFQRILETLGIDSALRKAGIKQGDTVFIGDHELEWQE